MTVEAFVGALRGSDRRGGEAAALRSAIGEANRVVGEAAESRPFGVGATLVAMLVDARHGADDITVIVAELGEVAAPSAEPEPPTSGPGATGARPHIHEEP